MHCERIEITQAHRPGGITPRRGLLLPCRVGAVGLVYAVGRSVGRCTAFLCCRRVVYPCTVPGVLWAVCGAVGVALRRRPTFLPKKDFLPIFSRNPRQNTARARSCGSFASSPPACNRISTTSGAQAAQRTPAKPATASPDRIAPARTTPPGTVQSHQHRENTSDFITHFQANFSDFPGLVLFPPA